MTSTTIRVSGIVLPPSLIAHLSDGTLEPQDSHSPSAYHLVGTETVRDAAARAWTYLRGAWIAWREADAGRLTGAGTGLARDRWLLPLLRELGYGQAPTAPPHFSVDGAEFPISHLWQHVPIHLLGPGVDLDRRNPGVVGAARAPQVMVQEVLNRSGDHLWAVLSNGLRLRLLRDSTAMVGAAYVEFDLESIFDGELYADWLTLFQLAHVSRLERRGDPEPSVAACWLEVWRSRATDAGARALGRLQYGVEQALRALGSGFLTHPSNAWLVTALRQGEISPVELHRALLRLVYRLLFCFVAEDRGLLLDPAAEPAAHERYARYFSTSRLRRLSRLRAGGPYGDLWHGQQLALRALSTRGGLAQLALARLGGIFDPDGRGVVPSSAPHSEELLYGAELNNADLLRAIRSLAWIEVQGGRVQGVDYRHLGAEELGSVYESLLELNPVVDLEERTFGVERLAGNERKTSGSYYTPPDLISALLDTALDPLIERAAPPGAKVMQAEVALLELTVCDPACGSGGFLVAAARRIAQRLADVRAGESQATSQDVQHAMRDVVGRCVYGVDLNDLAAELAKVSLWLEALEPGKPLSFLDARIRTGNALIGTTPALLEAGLPDAAFKELEGDDKKVAAIVRKRNHVESGGQDLLVGDPSSDLETLAEQRRALLGPAETVEQVERQRELWAGVQHSAERERQRRQADAWCAAFVWPLMPDGPIPPTAAVVRRLGVDGAHDLAETENLVAELAEQYRFFHWHLEFPEIFVGPGTDGPDGWPGGFSCMLGNPPWERVKLQEHEFFAARDPEIATAPNAATRRKLITRLVETDPTLWAAFAAARRAAEGQSALLRLSGRYPLNGRGDVNTYAVFSELSRSLAGPNGRAGVIAPTGIATDATTQYFFKDLVVTKSLAALYDFENAKPVFEGVHRSFKFCLLTMAGREDAVAAATFAFFLHDPSQIAGSEFALTPEEITLLNPNTGTCPVFRTRRDAEITLGIYHRVPVLIKEGDPDGNPWGISFMTMFHMSNDSHLFQTREQLEADGWTLRGNIFHRGDDQMLPLHQGIMAEPFDHRVSDVVRSESAQVRQNQPVYLTGEEKAKPDRLAIPIYWVAAAECARRLPDDSQLALLGFRDITSATNERTVLPVLLPVNVGVGNKVPLLLTKSDDKVEVLSILAGFAVDFVARQKLGGVTLNYFYVRQFPVPTPVQINDAARWDRRSSVSSWLRKRATELVYVSWDFQAFAESIGFDHPPFTWNPERRELLRAELDAAVFHTYGLVRSDVDYIMETFPIVKRKDLASHGEYRTKCLILEIYDAMQRAIDTGVPYQTILDPPPGEGPRHAAKED